MNPWLRKDKAKACPIHTAVLSKAATRLAEDGVFAKDDVLEDLNFGAVRDSCDGTISVSSFKRSRAAIWCLSARPTSRATPGKKRS